MVRSLPLIAAMILCTVVANLLLKTGAVADPAVGFVAKLLQPCVLLGLAFFGAGAMLYIIVLSKLALNVAQSMLALQYVGVTLGSVWVLGEPMPPARLLGAAMITAGVLVVAWSNVR
jgi:drug/metabolite transporter (DMT)-like permease